MPINIPNDLPAWDTLEQEKHLYHVRKNAHVHRTSVPLRILILNLMPQKD